MTRGDEAVEGVPGERGRASREQGPEGQLDEEIWRKPQGSGGPLQAWAQKKGKKKGGNRKGGWSVPCTSCLGARGGGKGERSGKVKGGETSGVLDLWAMAKKFPEGPRSYQVSHRKKP